MRHGSPAAAGRWRAAAVVTGVVGLALLTVATGVAAATVPAARSVMLLVCGVLAVVLIVPAGMLVALRTPDRDGGQMAGAHEGAAPDGTGEPGGSGPVGPDAAGTPAHRVLQTTPHGGASAAGAAGSPTLPIPSETVEPADAPRPARNPEPEPRRSPVVLPELVASSASGYSAERGRVGPMWVYAASAVGQSHLASGLPCEDAYALAGRSPTTCVAAVADGVGNAKLANTASQIAATVIVGNLVRGLEEGAAAWPDIVAESVDYTVRKLSDVTHVKDRDYALWTLAGKEPRAQKTGRPAATVAAAAVREIRGGGHDVFWLSCGDAAVLRLGPSGWDWLNGPFEPNRASTASLPGQPSAARHGRTTLDDGQSLVLATDGFAEAVNALPDELARVLSRAVSERVSAAVFASVLDFEIPGLFDDKTVVLLSAP